MYARVVQHPRGLFQYLPKIHSRSPLTDVYDIVDNVNVIHITTKIPNTVEFGTPYCIHEVAYPEIDGILHVISFSAKNGI